MRNNPKKSLELHARCPRPSRLDPSTGTLLLRTPRGTRRKAADVRLQTVRLMAQTNRPRPDGSAPEEPSEQFGLGARSVLDRGSISASALHKLMDQARLALVKAFGMERFRQAK